MERVIRVGRRGKGGERERKRGKERGEGKSERERKREEDKECVTTLHKEFVQRREKKLCLSCLSQPGPALESQLSLALAFSFSPPPAMGYTNTSWNMLSSSWVQIHTVYKGPFLHPASRPEVILWTAYLAFSVGLQSHTTDPKIAARISLKQ